MYALNKMYAIKQVKKWLFCLCGYLLLMSMCRSAEGQALPRFDFATNQAASNADKTLGWQIQHDISRLDLQKEGLRIAISGDDPYMVGPVRDYPMGMGLWARIRLKSDQGGTGQIFYFPNTGGPSEAQSVKFAVRAGVWDEIKVPMPALGAGYRLRFDPPGSSGNCLLSLLAIEARPKVTMPALVRPEPIRLDSDSIWIQSGPLSIVHAHHQMGGFAVLVGDQPMGVGYSRPQLGYRLPANGGQAGLERWMDVARSGIMTATREGEEIIVRATCRDADGGTWYLHRAFRPGQSGFIHVLTTVQVDRDREILFLPMFLMLPGVAPLSIPPRPVAATEAGAVGVAGNTAVVRRGFAPAGSASGSEPSAPVAATSFGQSKTQALFAGLEYLDRDEVSSSEADIRGPGANRRLPDSLKVTFPLMAIQSGGNYVGLIWDHPKDFTPLFDSPDRTIHAGGHLMGVLFPGSDGINREEGSLVPYEGTLVKANKPIVLSATIIGGQSADMVAAVQQYVALRGLPPIPKTMKWQDYAALTLDGFLTSGIRAGNQYRHAYPNFPAARVADVPTYLDWLLQQPGGAALKPKVGGAPREALAEVRIDDLIYAGIGHIRYPVAPFVYGHVDEAVRRAKATAEGLLGRFDARDRVLYRPAPNGTDLGKTHFAPDANGMTAQVVVSLLENALLSGDKRLILLGVAKLRALDLFSHTVPRGAQTWEVPLHTPDILASANLLRAYTLGYEVTGEPGMLEKAKYWAWTGVPFVYLQNPTDQPVGSYATIAVYGATQWVAPNWMGLPVQWCGLVYADALYRFKKYDPTGPWEQIANGITASGVQQTWPRGLDAARIGLLPDSFNLRAQSRNDAAINPATLLVNAQRLYNRPSIYDFQSFPTEGVYVFAPGEIDMPTLNGQPLPDVPDSERPKTKPDPKKSVRESTKDSTKDNKDGTREEIRSGKAQGVGERRIGFTVHGWSAQPYFILVNGLRETLKVTMNRQPVPLTGPNQFDAATGRLVLQAQGQVRVEISE